VKNEEKPTRKTQREGKVERRINDNGKMRDWERKGHEPNSCGYSRPNCEREYTELVTFRVTFQAFE
jgi:hypothetical protein